MFCQRVLPPHISLLHDSHEPFLAPQPPSGHAHTSQSDTHSQYEQPTLSFSVFVFLVKSVTFHLKHMGEKKKSFSFIICAKQSKLF